MPTELSFERLRRQCDPKLMHCETTEEISPLEEIIGQKRAVKALKFGLDIDQLGFNIYAAGYPGTGKTTAVKDFLEEVAEKKPVPSDWCYVNNFDESYEPKAVRLPPGEGKNFQTAMSSLIAEVQGALPKVFESEEFAAKKEATVKAIQEERNELFSQLNERAQKEGFVLQSTPIGLLVIPVLKGKPLSDRDFLSLSPQIRNEIQKRREKVNADLRGA
ncbi:MAG: AAA family ATPase, partial [Candidatus Bathyarchaeota archaeon]|nr:AAA family ATPase [Candidatus Bathyarchaeota archaeon]